MSGERYSTVKSNDPPIFLKNRAICQASFLSWFNYFQLETSILRKLWLYKLDIL